MAFEDFQSFLGAGQRAASFMGQATSLTREHLFNFTLEVAGHRELDFALSLFNANIKDLTPVWTDVREQLFRTMKEQFDTEGTRSGKKWAALSEPYRIWKERHFPGALILVRTGRLRDSLTRETSDSIFRPGRLGMLWGTKVPYGIYHQTGTETMPARPPIRFMGRQDSTRIAKLIQEFIFKSGQGYKRAIV